MGRTATVEVTMARGRAAAHSSAMTKAVLASLLVVLALGCGGGGPAASAPCSVSRAGTYTATPATGSMCAPGTLTIVQTGQELAVTLTGQTTDGATVTLQTSPLLLDAAVDCAATTVGTVEVGGGSADVSITFGATPMFLIRGGVVCDYALTR